MIRHFTLLFSFLIFFFYYELYGQNNNEITETEITISKYENYSIYNIVINNSSDSLLCVFFSGFHGVHNTDRFELPVVERDGAYDIYKMTVHEFDKYIYPQCRYLQVLTIKPNSKKLIDIYIKKTDQPIKIIVEYTKLLMKEKKFLRKFKNKNCLGRRFESKTIELIID